MKRRLATIYAACCTAFMAVGFLIAAIFAFQAGVTGFVWCIVGFFIGFAFSPIVHELGHVVFAKSAKMKCVYVKCFCFKVYEKEGRKRFWFDSPFAPDQTQVMPTSGGNMQKRASLYAVGGLIFGGAFALLVLLCCVCFNSYFLWGMLPYASYLFLLNLLPLEYPSGKTDALVCVGLNKGEPAEKTMLSAMEIQGQLFEGKSFSEIEERWYFDLPQLCEDEPLFAVMLDLKYRYYMEKGNVENARSCLERLTSIQGYLSDEEFVKLCAELTYLYSIFEDIEGAEECGKHCAEYLKSDEATAKRVLLAYSKVRGKTDAIEPLKEQAKACLGREKCMGLRKFEEILISRI